MALAGVERAETAYLDRFRSFEELAEVQEALWERPAEKLTIPFWVPASDFFDMCRLLEEYSGCTWVTSR